MHTPPFAHSAIRRHAFSLLLLFAMTLIPVARAGTAPGCPDPVFIVGFDGDPAISCPRPKMQFDFFSTYATTFVVLQYATDTSPLNWLMRANGSAADSPLNIVLGNAATDYPIEADFDGDGRNDPTVFDTASQLYRYRLVAAPAVERTITWGNSATDQVLELGDYDCDGITDPTFVRVNGSAYEWHIRTSGPGGDRIVPFGNVASGIQMRALVGADYTGDGCDDLAMITYPETGSYPVTYHIGDATSGALRLEREFGLFVSDYTIPGGDYLGDERTDFVLARTGASSSSPMQWMIVENGGPGTLNVTLGVSVDLPLRGDFDGDGKDDPAVRKGGTNIWMWRRSSDGITTQTTIGNTRDFAVPTAGVF